jgi:hypothetical protein
LRLPTSSPLLLRDFSGDVKTHFPLLVSVDENQEGPDAGGQPAAFAPRREVAGPRRFFPFAPEAIVEWHTPSRPRAEREFVSLKTLRQRVETEFVLPAAMFVFHCGRCGSTLLGRMLEVDPANRVLLEPNALQRFIAVNRGVLDRPEVRRDLQTLVAAYGLAAAPEERRLVIKLSSTSIVHAELFRACFPSARCLYLLRDPIEVVASEMRGSASFLRPEKRAELAASFGGVARAVETYSDAEWYAWYVDQNLRHARQQAAVFDCVIDYASHRVAYLDVLNAGLESKRQLDDPEITAVLGAHSKQAGASFSAEEDARKVTPGLREVVVPLTREVYGWWRERTCLR